MQATQFQTENNELQDQRSTLEQQLAVAEQVLRPPPVEIGTADITCTSVAPAAVLHSEPRAE